MLIRSRSIRFAAVALAAATPLVASSAAPAFSDSSGADVDVSFANYPGKVGVSSSKGLSRVTIVLCNGTTLVADSWGGANSGEVAVSGGVRAVFIHSGNNTTTAAKELLAELAGDDAVKGESTGEIAFNGDKYCNTGGDNTGGDNTGGDNTGGDNTGGDNTGIGDPGPGTNTPAPSVSSNPAPGTTVLGVTIEKAGNPANSDVLSQTQAAPAAPAAELPRTGAVHIRFLTALALSLLAVGRTLRATFGRRIRSASFPG